MAKGYWYCPHCRAEVDPQSVSYQEEHVVCGANVQWIPGKAPNPSGMTTNDWMKVSDETEGEQDNATLLEACKHANELMAGEIERLKAENDTMRKALEWYADAGNYLGDNGELATAWKENENIKNKAVEAIKSPNL